MEQTIVQLPMQPPEIPTPLGDIGVIYQQPPPVLSVLEQNLEYAQEEESDQQEYTVPGSNIPRATRKSLEALTEFHQLTAEMLLRKLRMKPGSLRHLQKQLQPYSTGKKEDRLFERLIPPKQTMFGSVPYVYTIGLGGLRS